MGSVKSKTEAIKKKKGAHSLEEWEQHFSLVEMPRATAENHLQNSFGLPDDCLRCIALRLDLQSLCRLTRTCKTWKRVCDADLIWRALPNFRDEHFDSDESVKTQLRKRATLCFVPNALKGVDAWKEISQKTLSNAKEFPCLIAVMSIEDAGAGRTTLTIQFVGGFFVDNYGNNYEYCYHFRDIDYSCHLLQLLFRFEVCVKIFNRFSVDNYGNSFVIIFP